MIITIDHWQIACIIGVVAFLLLVMWIERQTPEERAAEERKWKKCSPRYNIFVDSKCVLGTDNRKLASDAYDRECKYSQKHVRLFDGGTIIKERKEL